jgi:hypothetical protein
MLMRMAKSFSFQTEGTSDLSRLVAGDHLTFLAVRFKYLSEAPISRLKTPGRLKGVVLSVHLTTDDAHTVQGCAVMVAPGLALCAAHVFRDETDRLRAGSLKALVVGTAEHGNELWNLRYVTFVPNTEICILSLSCISGLSADRTFRQASLTTRWPRLGERLVLVAFKAEESDCTNWKAGDRIRTYTLACAGKVTQHFHKGRGRMLPGPSIEVDFESWLGMSGGPVFDEDGWLVGVLSSSLSSADRNAPSFVSLVFPALPHPFPGGWMDPGPDVVRSLLTMADAECVVERREAVNTTYLEDGRISGCVYETWHDR